MRALLSIFAAVLSLGFIVEVPQTPAQRKEKEEQERRWKEALTQRYDLPALRTFLQQGIDQNKVCDGVDLTKSKIGKIWQVEHRIVTCGDWQMALESPTSDLFQLRWCYEYVPPKGDNDGVQKSIVVECQRLAKNNFKLISIRRVDEEMIVLTP